MSQNPLSALFQGILGMSAEKSDAFTAKIVKLSVDINTRFNERKCLVHGNTEGIPDKLKEMNETTERLVPQRDILTKQIEEDDKLIAHEKLKIKNLREEREDTKNDELTNVIKTHWTKIHEIEEHQTTLRKQKTDIDTQLDTIVKQSSDIYKRYHEALKNRPSFLATALEVIDDRLTEDEQFQ